MGSFSSESEKNT